MSFIARAFVAFVWFAIALKLGLGWLLALLAFVVITGAWEVLMSRLPEKPEQPDEYFDR